MKKQMHELSEEERVRTLDALYTAAGSIRGRSAMKLFLRDLLTESERLMLGRRILIARLLLLTESYETIRARTGAGFSTIGRVHRWLRDQMPGYEKAIAGLEQELDRRERIQQHAADPFAALRKKYALRFLLYPTRKNDARSPRRHYHIW